MVFDLAVLLVVKPYRDFERRRVCRVALFAFLDGILDLVLAETVLAELQGELGEAFADRGNVIEDFPEAFPKKPFIGILLDLDQVRHLKHILMAGKTHSDVLAGFDLVDFVFFHGYVCSCSVCDLQRLRKRDLGCFLRFCRPSAAFFRVENCAIRAIFHSKANSILAQQKTCVKYFL